MKKSNTGNYNKQRNYRVKSVIPLLCCYAILSLCGCSSAPERTLGDGVVCSFSDDDATMENGTKGIREVDLSVDEITGNTEEMTSEMMEEMPENGDGRISSDASSYDINGMYTDGNTAGSSCYVYVCGAVVNPDVYELPEDMHIVDAIGAAGGFAENANDNYINLALRVADGMRIYVPTLDENAEELMKNGLIGTDISSNGITSGDIVRSQTAAESGAMFESGNSADAVTQSNQTAMPKVNINNANETELMTLPGIGQSKASKIVAFREKNGAFKQISDIMKVDGIKNGMYDKIKEYITVE